METDITRPAQPPHTPQQANAGRPVPRRSWVIVAVVVAAVVVLGLGWWLPTSHHERFDENKNINSNEYQALFLTNGQVYFGKLADLNHKYVTIHDIYYLQVQQGQSATDGKSLQNASSSTDTNAQVSLAKLGSELHGPEDKMYISSDQVLFWENLTNNGKVAQAISAYQQKSK